MSWGERAARIAGGLLGARHVVKTEISTPNSAVNKLDDIFTNNRPKPQTELVTPEGLRIKTIVNENIFGKPVQSADDLTLEIRGKGGYESNEIYTQGGRKMPAVKQPYEVTPSIKPNPSNKPLGEAERIRVNGSPENIRGITRQNEAAETLAKNGYKVEQQPQLSNVERMSNPWLSAEKKPDFKIEGEIFDAYSPNKNTSAENIREYIKSKVQENQTRRIILNLDEVLFNWMI